MRSALLLALLVLVAGCTKLEDVEAPDTDSTAAVDTPGDTAATVDEPGPIGLPDSLLSRVWVRTDTSAAPGTIVVFLPTGTVVQTSCVETYRQDPWHNSGEGQVTITEDGTEIPTSFVVEGTSLTLYKDLVGGETLEEHYRRSDGALLCPETRE